ncbi:hypothetical protein ABZ672_43325, partial [Streptomyces mirabilis]
LDDPLELGDQLLEVRGLQLRVDRDLLGRLRRPGILVPPENPAALAAELRGWFGEADVRRRLKAAARSRRAALDGWATTARSLAGVLGRLPQQPRRAA